MKKIIDLRAHHFMCIPGYKGLNYNLETKNSWDMITKILKEDPQAQIKIVDGPDMLCLKCPHSSEQQNTCNSKFVSQLDNIVKEKLGVNAQEVYSYSEISSKIMELLDPQKHAEICGECMWRAYGVCADTFAKTVEKIKDILPR